jgi:hypothetical protein
MSSLRLLYVLSYLTVISQRNSASMKRLTPTMNKFKENLDLAKMKSLFLANLVTFEVEKNSHLNDREVYIRNFGKSFPFISHISPYRN